MLRAYADFDVSRGNLSVFSELSIRHQQVSGYLKPIFKDVEVYDPKQDAEKAWTQQVFESVIGGIVDPADRLRHWCSSRYLRIPPLHREFRRPLRTSSSAVSNGLSQVSCGDFTSDLLSRLRALYAQ